MYGASTRVLGEVIAAITGKPIDVVLRERLTVPLGMVDTSFDVPAAKLSRVVTVHQRTGARLAEQVNAAAFVPSVRGDGGLVSTAGDYGRFLTMLLNDGLYGGRRVAPASAIRAMTTNHLGSRTVERQVAADVTRSLPYPLGAGRDTWGLGFQLAAAPSTPTARSTGSYSWAGINNTHFWVDPARRVGVVVLMQVLPFYDEKAMALLSGTEQVVNTHVH
jgi:methyl acetate hydrolase